MRVPAADSIGCFPSQDSMPGVGTRPVCLVAQGAGILVWDRKNSCVRAKNFIKNLANCLQKSKEWI